MRRRQFLESAAASLASITAAASMGRSVSGAYPLVASRESSADVVIVGGGLGGCAAALAALRNGKTVAMTEPTDWIGGQLTQQAVPPDEHPWIEMVVVPRHAMHTAISPMRRGFSPTKSRICRPRSRVWLIARAPQSCAARSAGPALPARRSRRGLDRGRHRPSHR